MLLPDINVWLALALSGHQHHRSAQEWLECVSQGTSLFFCRITQQGFLRLVSTAALAGPDVVSLRDAWTAYDTMFSDPRVEFVSEPAGIEPAWRNFTQLKSFSPKVWNDAYLAAFAQCYGFEVITFDRGFKGYAGVKLTVLE